MPDPKLTADDSREGSAPGEPFLAICVPTYRRAAKLRRWFERAERIVAASEFRDRIEILVSDNASPDATPAVVAEARGRFAEICPIRVIRQPENIGGEPNIRFVYENARARYAWLCSDDDVLVDGEMDPMIRDLMRFEPEICISSFSGPVSGGHHVNIPQGASVELVEDAVRGVRELAAPAKITQYVMRTRELTPAERELSERISRQIAWFSAFGAHLFLSRSRKLLLRSAVVAREADDEGLMRYSPRVYGLVRDAMLLGVGDHPERARIERVLPRVNTDVLVVGHLFRHTVGTGGMSPDVAAAEWAHLRANLGRMAFCSWRNTIKLPVVLALFPLVHRWRARRYTRAA